MDNRLSTYTALRFKPILRSIIWGGHRIARLKGNADNNGPIGESWEISSLPGYESEVESGPLAGCSLPELCKSYGAELLGTDCVARYGCRFPLLIKFIDAATALSLQVHPDDATAARLHGSDAGKTEMWYVINSEPEAWVTLGFNGKVSRRHFLETAGKASIMDLVEKFPTHPGSAFMIPAGTLHSIGGGNFLAEIQQSSDLTYRVYDFDRPGSDGKPRKLHIAEAVEAVNLNNESQLVLTPQPTAESGRDMLADSPYFKVERLTVNAEGTLLKVCPESFRVLMCVDGSVEIEGAGTLPFGHSVLIPACSPSLKIKGNATLLQVRI